MSCLRFVLIASTFALVCLVQTPAAGASFTIEATPENGASIVGDPISDVSWGYYEQDGAPSSCRPYCFELDVGYTITGNCSGGRINWETDVFSDSPNWPDKDPYGGIGPLKAKTGFLGGAGHTEKSGDPVGYGQSKNVVNALGDTRQATTFTVYVVCKGPDFDDPDTIDFEYSWSVKTTQPPCPAAQTGYPPHCVGGGGGTPGPTPTSPPVTPKPGSGGPSGTVPKDGKPKKAKTNCAAKGRRVLCPGAQTELVKRLEKEAKQAAKALKPLPKAVEKRKKAKDPREYNDLDRLIIATFTPVVDLLTKPKAVPTLPTVKVNLPRTAEEWKKLLLPIAEKKAEDKWGDARLYKLFQFARAADSTLGYTNEYLQDAKTYYEASPANAGNMNDISLGVTGKLYSDPSLTAEERVIVASYVTDLTGAKQKLINHMVEMGVAAEKVTNSLPGT